MRSVMTKTLHDYRKPIAWWSIGLVATAVMMMAVYPSVKDSAPELAGYVENMPDAMKAMFGMEGMDYTSPAGYLNTELFSFLLPFAFAAFAMGAGSRAIAGEEDRQTLDLLLSTPVTRGSVLLHKVGALVIDITVLSLVLWVSLWLSGLTVSFDLSAWLLLAASLNCALIGLVFGGIALLWGSWRGGRGAAIGVSAALLVSSYLLNSLAGVVDVLEPIRWMSPFYWFARNDVVRNGLAATDIVVLIGITGVLVWLSVLAFDRRDLHA